MRVYYTVPTGPAAHATRPDTISALREREEAHMGREVYAVVINHEEQYSIWPADREALRGWKAVGLRSEPGKSRRTG